MLPRSILATKTNSVTPKDNFHPSDCNWNPVGDYHYDDFQIDSFTYDYTRVLPPNTTPPLIDVQFANENDPPGTPTPCLPGAAFCENVYPELDEDKPLRYRVFFPKDHDYANTKLPVIVYFHAGAYSDCSAFDSDDVVYICKEFAKKAFIAISVEYRRGKISDLKQLPNPIINPQGFTSAQMELAIYRAQQDGRGAIRSLMARNNNPSLQHDGKFIFDADQFFIGGQSAGGGIANGIVFYKNQGMLNTVFPNGINGLTIEQALGPVFPTNTNNIYFGANIPANWPSFKGLLTNWGGLGVPKSAENNPYSFFDQYSLIPMIAFHGQQDKVVYFENTLKQDVYFSTAGNTALTISTNKVSTCLVTSGDFYAPNTSTATLKIYSTLNLHCLLAKKGIFTELYVDTDMGHGIKDFTATKKDNFSCGGNTANEVYTYIVERAFIFFRQIMNATIANPVYYGKYGSAQFVDCKNERVGCTDSLTACPNQAESNCDLQ